jgi:signal transduction histidine kinase
MRSLAFKLTLAFLIVGLAGAILVAVLVRQSTRVAFADFVLDQEQEALASGLEEFYQTYGTWEGLAIGFKVPPGFSQQNRRQVIRTWELFTLVDQDGRVIFSGDPENIGHSYSGSRMNNATPIQVDGATVGWLIREPVPEAWLQNSPEWRFIQQVTRASQISALFAAALALLLGGLLAYTLTRSLRELKDASEDIARGNLGRQVDIRSKDELGELADSFNQMSLGLARATQARRQMTADIAHDLRTPLSVIAGYTEALSDGKLSGSPEIFDVLHQETQYLSRLIDDLRLLSLADAGELPLNLQPVNPESVMQQAAVRHAVTADRLGIKLRVAIDRELPSIQADPERLSQVFDNLIGNALRHTPSGGEIVLTGERMNGSLRFRVQDSGSGISAEDLPKIFDRFYRGESSRTHPGESGLGLAIAKSIVEAHHGSIGVESQPGQGSTFSVLLPEARN